MAKLSALVAICMVVFVAGHDETHARNKRTTIQVTSNVNVLDWLCQNNPFGLYFSWCTATTASPQTSTKPGATTGSTSSSTLPTVLESTYWCQLSNKTYLSLGQTFLQTPCIMCQCTKTKDVVCNSLKCMTAQCIDGSTPTVRRGQCCQTCAYEVQANSCDQNGVIFPHGTIIKTDGDNVQCWCQSGTIECRKSLTTVTTWEYFSSSTSAYLAIVVICLVMMFGTVLCCGCGLLYYYYYQQQQQSVQQAYEQYYNNAGWQPMNEDGQVGDAAAKESEAQNATEHNYPTGHSAEFVPPPYAVYTGPYGSDAGKTSRNV